MVLFLGVPSEALDKNEIQRFFGSSAVNSWPVPKIDKLEECVSQRSSQVEALEQAELKLQKSVTTGIAKGKLNVTNGSGSSGAKLARSSQRPTHQQHHVAGPKLDTIDELRQDLPNLENQIRELREKRFANLSQDGHAIFVEFEDQESALQVYEPEAHHHSPLSMQEKFINVQPKEVLWQNLNIPNHQRATYWYLATALVIATIILWSIPVGIIGTLSNISYLADKVRWLHFLNNLPDPVLGFLTGFVPPFLLSSLVSYMPKLFRCE